MAIAYEDIYFVEKERNVKYQWLMFVVAILVFIFHGVLFHWLPGYFRSKRDLSLRYKPYFKFLKIWESWTGCFCFKTRWGKWYYQPSLVLLASCYIGIAVAFCFLETKDIEYEPHYYIVGKRISRVAMGNLIPLFLCIMKSDLVSAVSGLQHDRITFLHKWLGRFMWLLITIHFVLSCIYWLGMQFDIMLQIPPQIFGMMSYGCMFFLTWGSMKFIRSWAFDFFLAQHRVFNFIMLLMAFFHNPGNKAVVLIAVHSLVVDRIVGRVIGFLHKKYSPTKGVAEFEIVDEGTIVVTYPMKVTPQNWWSQYLPKVYNWKPGQHVYLNVWNVSKFQYHPFTICSLPESGNITLVIRKQNGFTKKLFQKLQKLKEEDPETPLQMKASIAGPVGGKHQSLLHFDTALFFAAGAGASYTFPVALDLVKQIKHRDSIGDHLHRPEKALIRFVWVIRKKSNLLWFKNILRQFLPYTREKLISLEVYITQEVLETEVVASSNRISGSSSDQSSKDGLMEYDSNFDSKKTDGIDVFDKSVSEESSISMMDESSIEFIYCRPDLGAIIHEESMKLTDRHVMKSLAVSSCGPNLFIDEIKVQCNINRRPRYAPDIYCHSEAF